MTKFEIGDVVTVDDSSTEGTIESFDEEGGPILDNDADKRCGWHPSRVHLVRRASESQREGGFAGWVEVDRNTTHRKYEGRNSHGAACFAIGDIEDDSPHTSTVEPCQAYPNEIELGERGYRSRFSGGDWTNHSYVPYGDCGCVPGAAHGCEPPQPAPMTRAARVLAKLETDPYLLDRENISDVLTRASTDGRLKNEAARLRMARMSLDRPLDAEQARWERLVCSKVPTGRR